MNGSSAVSGNIVSSSSPTTYSTGGGGVCMHSGIFTMNDSATVSGNTVSAFSSSYASAGGGVLMWNGTFTMNNSTTVSGNMVISDYPHGGGGVFVKDGIFTMGGGTIYGSGPNANKLEGSGTMSGVSLYKDSNGTAKYGDGTPIIAGYQTSSLYTNATLTGVGAPTSYGISNISYTPVSGSSWTVQGDGRYQSPTITDNELTKMRVNFTSIGANAALVIKLDVSSEANYDYAFVGNLDTSASISSNYVQISGTDSQTVTITVPSAGSHYVEIGYGKDGGVVAGEDCAWFKIE
jgi:hypothetical protein